MFRLLPFTANSKMFLNQFLLIFLFNLLMFQFIMGEILFKALDNVDRQPQVSIFELDFHGVISMGGTAVALFTWKGNPGVRYILKFRKLYSGGERTIDGVVGDISESEVVLMQGEQKVVYPRN